MVASRWRKLSVVMIFGGLGIMFATYSSGSVYHADTFDPDRPAVDILSLFGMRFSGVSSGTGSFILFGLLGLGLAVFVAGIVLWVVRWRKT